MRPPTVWDMAPCRWINRARHIYNMAVSSTRVKTSRNYFFLGILTLEDVTTRLETSDTNNPATRHSIPEELSTHIHRYESPKLRKNKSNKTPT